MTKDKVQHEAVNAWIENGKRGTLELATGVGKTIAALHCLTTMPRGDGKVHLFLAETEARLKDLNKDIEKYFELFKFDIRKHYRLVFRCYQGMSDVKDVDLGLVIADEIHMSLTPVYSKFFYNNNIDAIVGLSATIDNDTSYTMDDGLVRTKGDMLNQIAPICYSYTMKQALEDDIGRKVNVYVVRLNLNDQDKIIKSGSPKKTFYQTEKAKYEYCNKSYNRSFYSGSAITRDILIRSSYLRRAEVLYNSPTRISETIKLIKGIPGKSIVFSNSLDAVIKVTPNTVSSKNTADQNEAIRDAFDNDLISTIGSYKMLRQGANLVGIDNAILMSYFGSKTHITQQIGRLRKNMDKIGRIVIFVANETYEEDVLVKVLNNIPYEKIFTFDTVEEVLKKIENEESSIKGNS